MVREDETLLEGGARLVGLSPLADARGKLTPLALPVLGLSPVRAFVVEGRAGMLRGGHAHRTGRQLLWAVAGAIRVELRLAGREASVMLTPGECALLVEPGTWAAQHYGEEGGVLLVLCDTPYDAADYMHEMPAASA